MNQPPQAPPLSGGVPLLGIDAQLAHRPRLNGGTIPVVIVTLSTPAGAFIFNYPKDNEGVVIDELKRGGSGLVLPRSNGQHP